MNYFENLTSLAEVKLRYRELALKYHPDRGGDLKTMQMINVQYPQAVACIKIHTTQKDTPNYCNWQKQKDIAPEIMNIINKFQYCKGLSLEICGLWLWIGGETRIYKEYLKENGCLWAPVKKLWYWRAEENRKKWPSKALSMDEIRLNHGSQQYHPEEKIKLCA